MALIKKVSEGRLRQLANKKQGLDRALFAARKSFAQVEARLRMAQKKLDELGAVLAKIDSTRYGQPYVTATEETKTEPQA